MYSTRPLSLYQSVPEAISIRPEGPNSGYLVLQDEESTPTYMFGLLKSKSIRDFPVPQNKLLSIEHSYRVSNGNGGSSTRRTHDEAYLIPVVNQPLSSNCYYVIKADWRHKGEAYASSKEEYATNCFFFRIPHDVKPRPLDPNDIYQQFELSIKESWLSSDKFIARSVAPDGIPPSFLRKKGWEIKGHTARNFTLGEANGLNSALRARLPDFNNFPLTLESSDSALVVGKWYCPFMFIKEWTEKDQMKKSMFYQMTLEQRWERVFATQKINYGEPNEDHVNVDVVIPTDTVRIGGHEAVQVERNDGGGVVWFSSIDVNTGAEQLVGLSRLIVETMMWEQERGGWIKGQNKQIRVAKQEKCEQGFWGSYGCYVLVESFVLRRNDGSLVLTWDFRHSHQLRSKWE